MLILSRKEGEAIVIGKNGEIRITIVNLKGNQVRIGLEAPKTVDIYREEIADKYKACRTKVEQCFVRG